jgi:hypothetical protein
MAQSRISDNRKRKPGRPKVGASLIGVRIPPSGLAKIDDWRRAQSKPKPSRPEAIRRLVEQGLHVARPLRPHGKKAAAKASNLAGREIDQMTDTSAPRKERERRKRRLMKGPEEFRDIRRDRPKG